MNYTTARLSTDALHRLNRMEQDLSSATGDTIILVAYKKNDDASGSEAKDSHTPNIEA